MRLVLNPRRHIFLISSSRRPGKLPPLPGYSQRRFAAQLLILGSYNPITHSEQAVVDNNNNQMVCCYPSTPKKMAMTLACFFGGAAVMALGVHLSYVHVAPQQARTKARNDFVKDKLRKKYGKLASDP